MATRSIGRSTGTGLAGPARLVHRSGVISTAAVTSTSSNRVTVSRTWSIPPSRWRSIKRHGEASQPCAITSGGTRRIVPPPPARSVAATTATCTSSPSPSSVATSIDHVCSTNASKPGAEGSVTASRVSPPSLSSTVDSPSTRSTPAQTRATTRKVGNPHRHPAGRGGARRRRSSSGGVSPSTGSVIARPRRGRTQR